MKACLQMKKPHDAIKTKDVEEFLRRTSSEKTHLFQIWHKLWSPYDGYRSEQVCVWLHTPTGKQLCMMVLREIVVFVACFLILHIIFTYAVLLGVFFVTIFAMHKDWRRKWKVVWFLLWVCVASPERTLQAARRNETVPSSLLAQA